MISLLSKMNGAVEFRGTSTWDDSVIPDHISDNAKSIMDGSVGFVNNHSAGSSSEDGDSLRTFKLFDQEHLGVVGSEFDLLHLTSLSQLFWGNFCESWDDSSTSGQSQKFDIGSRNPSHSWEFVLKQQVVSLIIESPLAHGNVSSGVLHLLDHIDEVLLFLLVQSLIVFGTLHRNFVFVLELWWLEWAGQNANLGIMNFLWHLRMREILVDQKTFDELGVFNRTTSLWSNLIG